jgi:hypothetical protein
MRKFNLILFGCLLSSFSLVAQLKVEGYISDQSGEALAGVSVVVKGTTNAAISDVNGYYSLTKVPQYSTLVFSYVGMIKEEVPVAAKTRIDVVLRENVVNLDEIVANGYGVAKKRDLTGAIQSVKSSEITITPTGNMMQALQGKVAGLDIVRTSGKASAGVNMILRGRR